MHLFSLCRSNQGFPFFLYPPSPILTFACSFSPLNLFFYILHPSPSSYDFLFLTPPLTPPIFTYSPRGHVAHLGDDEDEDDDGADDDETHTQ